MFRGTDAAGVVASLAEYRPARAEELADGLSLVLGGPDGPAAPEQVAEFTKFAGARGIDVRELWVLGEGGRMTWAVLPIPSPGRTMLLLAPTHLPRGVDVGPLLEALCSTFAGRGVHLAQVLADPAEATARRAYTACAFAEIAELLYLQMPVARVASPPALPAGWSWHTYGADSHAWFARAIGESYRDSLDCPALNGLRDIEDVIAGHRASGQFDPQYWFVLVERDAPAGALLLTRVPNGDMAELVYLGLAPWARRRGIGDVMMRKAAEAVRRMRLPRVTLAVDARNAPALKLYYRHGMQHIGTKVAMLRDLRRAASAPAEEGAAGAAALTDRPQVR